MKASISTARFLVLASLFALAIPTLAMAQGRGRGRGQERQERQERQEKQEKQEREERGEKNKSDRKCAKFVNCHDASDGRRDGKGPDRRSSLERLSHRHRNRDLDDDARRRLQRRHDRNRELVRRAVSHGRRRY